MNSKRLKELTEEYIGQGNSKKVFGKWWKELYDILSEEEDNLTEEMFIEGLRKCRFKNPEYIGLISLICPPYCLDITERTMGKKMRVFFSVTIYLWYTLFILTLLTIPNSSIIFMMFCAVYTSYFLRDQSKLYNTLELIYSTLRETGKVP